MSRIHGRHTGPELRVRRTLHDSGLRFRLHRRDLPGSPDVLLVAQRVAVFVHGCFWHGHWCKDGHIPRSNTSFWRKKIARNRQRHAQDTRKLRSLGWRVFVIWECRIDAGIRRLLQETSANS